MAYEVQWYIEKQIQYVRFWNELTIEDFRAELEVSRKMMDTSDRPLVHVIIDVNDVTKSIGLKEMAMVMAGREPHPRGGWTILVGQKDAMMKFASSVGRQLLKLRQRNFDTVQEALDFLRDIDANLDWSQANDSLFVREPAQNKREPKE